MHRGTAWFEPPWWTVRVEPSAVEGRAATAAADDVAADTAVGAAADGGRVQGGSYAEAHALAVKLIATASGVEESSVTLLLELLPAPREPS